MMYGLDGELDKTQRPDGSFEYPAVSCKAIKECYPEKLDG